MIEPHFRYQLTPDGPMVTHHTSAEPFGVSLDCFEFGMNRWDYSSEVVAGAIFRALGKEIDPKLRSDLVMVLHCRDADEPWTLTEEDIRILLDGKADAAWWSRVSPPPF